MFGAQAHPENAEEENILDLVVGIMQHLLLVGSNMPAHFCFHWYIVQRTRFTGFGDTDKDHADAAMTQPSLI